MKTPIVPLGNTQAILIPQPLLEQIGLSGEVEVTLESHALVIRSTAGPRAGWAEAFRKIAERGDDALLDVGTPSLTSWDESEWEWR